MKIELNEKQIILIKYAVEYLGRHCIGQPDFKPPILEDWINKEERTKDGYTLTDIWKQKNN